MSVSPYLTIEQLEFIRNRFKDFKTDPKVTVAKIASELGRHKTTVAKRYKQIFGEEYSRISKGKMIWNIKLSNEQIKGIFIEYKNGIPLIKLANKYKVNRSTLIHRMQKVIGEDYSKLAAIRRYKDAKIKRKIKVNDNKIEALFEIYKNNHYSLSELATRVGITENSLIFRFNSLFGNDYKKISLGRRDERKVTRQQYVKAFAYYRSTSISLIQIAEELGIRVSSLASRFQRMFKHQYYKVALKKFGTLKVIRRGRSAENLALKYLELTNKKFEDVRQRAIIKNSLKRPDFLVGGKFVEVKAGYITQKGFGKIKGYEKIKSSYLGKETIDGRTISQGIIISITGFSPNVIKLSRLDGIELIGPNELKLTFEKNKRFDLLNILNKLRIL